jgi:hypothetical protein
MKLRPLSGRSTTFLLVDDVAESGGFAPEERSVGLHCDGFGQRTQFQWQVEAKRLPCRESNALPGEGPETTHLDADPIRAWRESRDEVFPVRTGHDGPGEIGSNRSDRDHRASNARSTLIDHGSSERSAANLSGRRHRQYRAQGESQA